MHRCCLLIRLFLVLAITSDKKRIIAKIICRVCEERMLNNANLLEHIFPERDILS